jgi:hypothetical protein
VVFVVLTTIFVLKVAKLLTFLICELILTCERKSKKVIHKLCTSFEHWFGGVMGILFSTSQKWSIYQY